MWNFLKRFRDPAKPSQTATGPRGEFVREFAYDGYVVQVDESQQTLKLHAEDDLVWLRTALNPKIASLQKRIYSEKFISASMLAYKAKQFDDGLYAAVDLAAQHGAGKYPGKVSLLTELTRVLARDRLQGKMSEVVFAAARLGGIPVEQPVAMEPAVAG
jgi:hypothetical protein